VAQAYEDFLDLLVVDTRDFKAAEQLRTNGPRVQCTQTVMRTADDKAALARTVLSLVCGGLYSGEPTAGATSELP
jgi:2-phospho-L-lactate transferase/gluconeogenesis factor (CofD/UPF0052 family)